MISSVRCEGVRCICAEFQKQTCRQTSRTASPLQLGNLPFLLLPTGCRVSIRADTKTGGGGFERTSLLEDPCFLSRAKKSSRFFTHLLTLDSGTAKRSAISNLNYDHEHGHTRFSYVGKTKETRTEIKDTGERSYWNLAPRTNSPWPHPGHLCGSSGFFCSAEIISSSGVILV